MSSTSVLYDAPGPRARRRAAVGGAIASLAVVILIGVVVKRLADQGQFAGKLWGPILNPSDESFLLVWKLIGKGALATLTAAVLAIAFSLVIGGVVGVARMMLGRRSRMPIVALIELLRGLPVVITIYFASRVLPEFGVDLTGMPGGSGLWFLVIGLTAYNCVIIAEIIRAGVASLPGGQREAALAIGLTPGATMRLVLLPQAVRVMLPALISQLVVILKDTSLAAVLGLYTELLRQGNLIALNLHNPIQILSVVGVIFIVINYSLSRLATWADQRSVRKPQATRLEGVPAEAG
ncbi:MAG: amino acid ABC transporter permease [Dermatophilaceae bacterium]